AAHPALRPFPTRRSSDLRGLGAVRHAPGPGGRPPFPGRQAGPGVQAAAGPAVPEEGVTAVGVALAILVGMGWALAGLAALLLLGLLIPLRASGLVKDLAVSESGGANLEPTSWRVQVDWGFGLVRFSSAKEPGSEVGAEWRAGGPTRAARR